MGAPGFASVTQAAVLLGIGRCVRFSQRELEAYVDPLIADEWTDG